MGTVTQSPRRQIRAASVRPSTYDPTERTVDLVWTTGAAVRRYDWELGEYHEVLTVTPEAVDLSRLNARAPLLDTHQAYELEHVVGVVLWARIEGGIGIARVQLSGRPELAGLRQDVADGVISQVSVGYDHLEWIDERREDGLYRVVTRWLPVELSLVPVPADAGAQTRSRAMAEDIRADQVQADEPEGEMAEDMPEEQMAEDMPEEEMSEDMPEGDPEAETMSVQTAIQVERQRVTEIQRAAEILGFRPTSRTVRSLIDGGVSLGTARKRLIDAKARAQEKSMTRNTHGAGVQVGAEADDNKAAGIAEAIMHRAGVRGAELTERARPYVHMRLLDICRMVAEEQGHRGVRSWDDGRVIRTAMRPRGERRQTRDGYHTTSDFPLLLADVTHKALAKEYEIAAPTFKAWAKRGVLTDFRPAYRLQMGSAMTLLPVNEAGEIKAATFSEKQESIQLSSYGIMMGLSRKMIVNDDLDAFGRLPRIAAQSVANLESTKVYDLLTSNSQAGPTMTEDNVALFHSGHGNLGVASDEYAAGIEAWKWADTALGLQTSLDGTPLNLSLWGVLVPRTQYAAWRQLVGAAFMPTTAGNALIADMQNLVIIPEARLDAVSPTTWYGLADPNRIEIVEYAYLAGQTGPRVEYEEGFDTDGMRMRVLHDFGVSALDYRGIVRNDGVPA